MRYMKTWKKRAKGRQKLGENIEREIDPDNGKETVFIEIGGRKKIQNATIICYCLPSSKSTINGSNEIS